MAIKILKLAQVVKEAGGERQLLAPLTTDEAYALLMRAQRRVIDRAFAAKRPPAEVVELSPTVLSDYVDNLRADQPDLELAVGLHCWARTANGGLVKVEVLRIDGDRVVVEDQLRHSRNTISRDQLQAR